MLLFLNKKFVFFDTPFIKGLLSKKIDRHLISSYNIKPTLLYIDFKIRDSALFFTDRVGLQSHKIAVASNLLCEQ